MSERNSNSTATKAIVVRTAGVIIGGLVLQTLVMIWWAGGMDIRMRHVEQAIRSMSDRIHGLEARE